MGAENSKKLSRKEIQTLKKHCGLTATEIKEFHKKYRQIGPLNQQDFLRNMRKTFPGRHHQAFCQDIFRVNDINGDGLLDFEEIIFAMGLATKGTRNDNVRRLFKLYDINNDGVITRGEANKVLKNLFRAAGATVVGQDKEDIVQEFFNKLDTDGDGVITEEEFMKRADDMPFFIKGYLDEMFMI